MTQSLDIRIRPATEEDIASCAICWGNRRDTYPSIYPLRLADPTVTREQRLERNARDLSRMLKDPYNVFHVACVSETQNSSSSWVVAGYSVWARPEALERDLRDWENGKTKKSCGSKRNEEDIDVECDHELSAKIQEESMQIKKQHSEGKRMWFLQQLFVSSEQQKRGIGTKLLQHGLEMIEQEEAVKQEKNGTLPSDFQVALTSSPQGKVLYDRYGFQDVYWFNPHFDDIDEQGRVVHTDVKWPLMIRQ